MKFSPFSLAAAATTLVALSSLCLPPDVAVAPTAVRHPHFQKRLEARVSQDATITVTYQTVTFDAAGAKKMAVGKAWHLANAHLEFSTAMRIGDHDFEAGKYSLKAKKEKQGKWSLVLDTAGRFDARLSDDVVTLKTEFDGNAPMFEHLSIDVHPSGDKKDTTLHLDVRFDSMLARCWIELPE